MLALAALLALAGGTIAVLELTRGQQPAGVVREAPADGGWRLAAGFGPLAVERVQRVPGVGHAPHGDAPADAVDEVRVRVRLRNALDHPIPFSPGQLRLGQAGAAGSTSPIDPHAGAGVIQPGDTVRREVAFLVPERVTRLSLLVDDLVARRPLPLQLGEVPSP